MAIERAYSPDYGSSGSRNSFMNSWLAQAQEKIPESAFWNDDDVIPDLAHPDQSHLAMELGRISNNEMGRALRNMYWWKTIRQRARSIGTCAWEGISYAPLSVLSMSSMAIVNCVIPFDFCQHSCILFTWLFSSNDRERCCKKFQTIFVFKL